jgi:signal transduction histidine kinase
MESHFAVAEHRPHRKKSGAATLDRSLNHPEQAALGALAMSIVHDLRNPLAAIYSAAEMLIESHLPGEESQRLARNVFSAAVRIKELLQDYVDHSRASERRLSPCNVRNLIADAVDRIAVLAEAQSVAVVQNIPADMAILADRRRIASVLSNLFVNALEAMPQGGSICISALAQEEMAVVKVRDSGPGVAPEIRDRVFEPFVTAGKSNGWGLGLASARQVIVGHGGEMWLESNTGKGACFAFSLPLL